VLRMVLLIESRLKREDRKKGAQGSTHVLHDGSSSAGMERLADRNETGSLADPDRLAQVRRQALLR